jgi:hypothetical protein
MRELDAIGFGSNSMREKCNLHCSVLSMGIDINRGCQGGCNCVVMGGHAWICTNW